jgi:hypothetical protein
MIIITINLIMLRYILIFHHGLSVMVKILDFVKMTYIHTILKT